MGGQLWPVGIRSHAGLDGVDEVVPAGGVGAASADRGRGSGLQEVLHGAGRDGVLPGTGESGVGFLHTGGGTKHRDLGGQSGFHGDQGPRPRGGGRVGPRLCAFTNSGGERIEELLAPLKVGAPARVLGQGGGDGGQPAQHPDSCGVRSGGVDAVIENRGRVGGVGDAALG